MNWRSGKHKTVNFNPVADYNDFVNSIETMTKSLHDAFGLIGEAMTAVAGSVSRIKPQPAKPAFPVSPTEMK